MNPMVWRATWVRETKVLLWCIAASVIQSYFMCGRCTSIKSYFIVFLFTLCLWIFLWRGNGYLAGFLTRRISWVEYPVKRLLVGVVTTVAYTFGSVLLLMTIFQRWANFNFGGGYYPTLYISVIVTILISLFLHSKYFLEYWRKSALDAERFRKESMLAKYELLKTSFNPELLFNSFHSLRSMVATDKESAVLFIKQLSDAYRYMLDSRDREMVTLKTELKFLSAYLFLLENRFAGRLKVILSLSMPDAQISPLALQLLVEATLHDAGLNENTSSLDISFQNNHHYLSMDASCESLPKHPMELNRVVDALRDRYKFLTSDPIDFRVSSGRASVQLPMINTDVSP